MMSAPRPTPTRDRRRQVATGAARLLLQHLLGWQAGDVVEGRVVGDGLEQAVTLRGRRGDRLHGLRWSVGRHRGSRAEGHTSSSSASLALTSPSTRSVCFFVRPSSSFSRARAVVLADLAVLDEPVEVGLGLATDVAHGDAGLLRLVVGQLDVVTPALLGELGHDAPDLVAVAARVDAEVAVADRLLDLVHRRLVEGDDEDGARLRVLERRELLQGRGCAVVLDRHLVEQSRVGAAGADAREVLLEDLDGLVHLLLGLEHRLFDHGACASSSSVVPVGGARGWCRS